MSESTEHSRRVALRCEGLWKSYDQHAVLKDLNLVVHAGEVCALLGRNGAGKSTLVKILSGAVRPDSGAIFGEEGTSLRFTSPREAMRQGIVPVHQKLSLFPHLSVRENLLGFYHALHRVQRDDDRVAPSNERLGELLAQLNLNLSLDTLVETLPLEDRQIIEIGRALVMNPRLLILDEPTAAADVKAIERLHGIVRGLTVNGIAVIYVSHRLDEVRQISDTLTLLRDGRAHIENAPMSSITNDQISAAMSADNPLAETLRSPPAQPRSDAPMAPRNVLEIKGLQVRSDSNPVSARIESGEIIGIAGLAGSGAMDLGLILGGIQPILAGELRLNGRRLTSANRAAYVRAGIGLIPQDRDTEGLFGILSALHNVSVQTLHEDSHLGVLSARSELKRITPIMESLRVRPIAPYAPAGSFSGGNAQKLVIGRQIADRRMRILVALEPTRGVDANARSQVWQELFTLRDRGILIIVVSTDTDELVHLCGKVYTMIDGSPGPTLVNPKTESEIFNAIAVAHHGFTVTQLGRA